MEFFLRAELGQIWGLFWGSKGDAFGVFLRADLGTVLGLKGGAFGLVFKAELGQI